MKQFNSQKWVLSAFLVAALGSQYYFSVSSKDISSIEMSSNATLTADQTQTIRDASAIVTRLNAVSGTPVASASGTPVAAVSGTAVVSGTPVARTEGTAGTAPCADCVSLTQAEVDVLKRALQIQIANPSVTVTGTAAPAADECTEGTQAEKLRCQREQRTQATRDKADLKRETERDALDARNEEFISKMEDAADRCRGEISCLTSRYTALLGRYTGRKAISPQIAQNAFKQYIEPQLKGKLASMDGSSDANDILSALSQNVPMEYRKVKEMAVLDVRQAVDARAASIKTTITEAKAAADAKDIQQSQTLLRQATAESNQLKADLNGDAQAGTQGIMDVLQGSLKESDSATWAYTQSQLSGSVRNLFSDLKTHYDRVFNAGLTTNPNQQTANGSTRGTRGGDNSSINFNNNGVGPALPGSTGVDGKISQPITGNNNVVFGNPTQTSTGTRRSRN